MKKIFLLLFLTQLSTIAWSQSFSKSDVYKAWEEEDLAKLITIHSQNPSLRSLVEEAIGQMDIKSFSLSFDELTSYTKQIKKDSPLFHLLTNALKDKKSKIVQNVVSYTPEDLDSYMQKNPTQRKFIEGQMYEAFHNSVTSLPLNELYYVERVMPYLDSQQITAEAKGRDIERRDILVNNLSDYMKKERAELSYLEYMLSMREHEYFRKKFRNICMEYASVKQSSRSVYQMESQYRWIVNRHMRPKDIQLYLQKEADELCAIINASRSEYCLAMGKKDFVKMSIIVPEPSYDCYFPTTGLDKVVQAYDSYDSTRDAINVGGKIASFFGAGIWGTIGQGVAEWFTESNLAENITDAQLEYVKDSYQVLEKRVGQQIDNAHKSIAKQIANNQEKFLRNARQ